MIKKSVFEDDLIAGMQRNLASGNKTESELDLNKAIDYLHSAADILDNANLLTQSNRIIEVLAKLANKGNIDPFTHNLNSQQMVSNLEDHGTVFPLKNKNDNNDDCGDNNNLDIEDEPSFEDEI